MLKLSTKSWISAFNAQASRAIIVAVQVGAVKIYVAAVEVVRKKKRQGETQKTIKIDGFLSFFHPLLNANVHFCRFCFESCFESHPVYDQTQGSRAVFSWLYGYLYCVDCVIMVW